MLCSHLRQIPRGASLLDSGQRWLPWWAQPIQPAQQRRIGRRRQPPPVSGSEQSRTDVAQLDGKFGNVGVVRDRLATDAQDAQKESGELTEEEKKVSDAAAEARADMAGAFFSHFCARVVSTA